MAYPVDMQFQQIINGEISIGELGPIFNRIPDTSKTLHMIKFVVDSSGSISKYTQTMLNIMATFRASMILHPVGRHNIRISRSDFHQHVTDVTMTIGSRYANRSRYINRDALYGYVEPLHFKATVEPSVMTSLYDAILKSSDNLRAQHEYLTGLGFSVASYLIVLSDFNNNINSHKMMDAINCVGSLNSDGYKTIAIFLGDKPNFDIRDITIKQTDYIPSNTYVCVIGRGGNIIVRKNHFVGGRNVYDEKDYTIDYDIVTSAREAAIEFNGIFKLAPNAIRYDLITQEYPWVFWIDLAGVLYGQYGYDISTRISLASGIVKLSACRGWNSLEYLERDMGLIIAYVKTDGSVAYRQLVGTASGNEIWYPEQVISEAGVGNTYINVHRLNDYRMGFAVTGCNKLFVSERVLIGQAIKPGFTSISAKVIGGANFAMTKDTDDTFDIESISWLSNNSVKIKGNYPISFSQTINRNNPERDIIVIQGGKYVPISNIYVSGSELIIEFFTAISPNASITFQATQFTTLQYNTITGSPLWHTNQITMPGNALKKIENNILNIYSIITFDFAEVESNINDNTIESMNLGMFADAISFNLYDMVQIENSNTIEQNDVSISGNVAIFDFVQTGISPV